MRLFVFIFTFIVTFSSLFFADRVEENVLFKSGSAEECMLEGVLTFDDEEIDAPAVIICHPHPDGGGEMNLPIIREFVKRLDKNDYTTLRFNFRGVGKSGCSFGQGLQGDEDIKGAITFLLNHPRLKPKKIFLWGYSYGSGAVFYITLQDMRVAASVLVGFSTRYIQGYNNIEGINNKTAPIQIFAGANDNVSYGLKEAVSDFVIKSHRDIKLTIIPKADHFFSTFWAGIFDSSMDFYEDIINSENKEKK